MATKCDPVMIVRSILVVDDDQYTLEALRRVLEPHGYAVSFAFGGRDAINLLGGETVDLVITDILMPDGDGLDLISTLRRNSANTRIVAMSAGGRVNANDYLLIARGFGVDAILKKPFTRDELLAAIKTIETRPQVSAPPFKT
jgi:two-component system cell cycle response regulator CpdR